MTSAIPYLHPGVPCKQPPIVCEEKVALTKVDEMAKSVIQAQTPALDGGVHIHHHYYNDGWGWGFWGWPGYHETVVFDNRSKRERDRDGAIALGIVFTIVALVTSYFLGQDWGRSSDASEKVEEVDHLRDRLWSRARYETTPEPHLPAVDDALLRTRKIFAREHTDAVTGLALKTSLVASSAIGLAGCVAMSGPLMVVGGAAAIVTGAGMLIRWGASRVETKNYSDAVAVHNEVQQLQTELG